jgi:hypothetical protein
MMLSLCTVGEGRVKLLTNFLPLVCHLGPVFDIGHKRGFLDDAAQPGTNVGTNDEGNRGARD